MPNFLESQKTGFLAGFITSPKYNRDSLTKKKGITAIEWNRKFLLLFGSCVLCELVVQLQP